MRSRIARLSDRALTLDGDTEPRIAVVLSQHAERWQAEIRLSDASGRPPRARTVQGRAPDCASIDVAVAVVVSTMLDSIRFEDTSTQTRETSQSAADSGRLTVGLFVAASPGLVPSAWLGGGLTLEYGSALLLRLSVSAYAPADSADTRGRGARLWGAHAGGELCHAMLRGPAGDLRLCAGVQAGAVLASGLGLTRAADAVIPMVLANGGPRLALRASDSVAIQLAVSAAWVGLRPRVRWNVSGEPDQSLSGERIALLAQIGITTSL